MKTKKEIAKKTKAAPKKKEVKKVASKVRTVSAVKKVVKKTKVAAAPKKRAVKKIKTMPALKLKVKKNQNFKRFTYMVLSLVLGTLIAGTALGFLEMVYIKNSLRMGGQPILHPFLGAQLFFFPAVYVLIFGAGLSFGAWLGFWGWRVVYVEHRHRMFQKK
ncbi:MAG: hypothetical protein PHW24_01615 [Candidatus Moranbacteria bacterium]|nr:hypothetical protein [Candidatus Moranbacteria bacterium]